MVSLFLYALVIALAVLALYYMIERDRHKARAHFLEQQLMVAAGKIRNREVEEARLRSRILQYQVRLGEAPGIQKARCQNESYGWAA